MKTKNNTHFSKILLLVGLLVLVGSKGWGQIVAYTLASSGAATAGIAANYPGQGRVLNISGITSSGYSGTNGQTCYGWNAVGIDSWVTSAFSTSGYINLSGSFQMKANTGVGPRDISVQYSLNGSSWTDTPTGSSILLTNALATYNFTLPSTCDNKSTVYVRWVQNSTYQLNGSTPIGTGSTNNASLKGVSIAGDAFSSPSTQASSISIISITPTTIKIGCTNGNGNNRIIKINTSNSFTDPVNDYNPSANTTYGGSGEQVIYNGNGSSVTVTVANSTNVYWFRVYDYNKMDALTRYKTESASGNPKECKLETIHTPTFTNVRLTDARLGATITNPTTGTVVERGIFWSTISPVDETGNLVSEASTEGGIYSLANIPVERGTTIYFKGFVTNESGTNMSEESSFTNFPVFTGTGTWETAVRWNVQQVPGANGDVPLNGELDNITINGICTLTAVNTVNNLTINASRSLTINPAKSLTVSGTLTNNGGTSGLVIKSTAAGTGQLMHNNVGINATVERYATGLNDGVMSRYHLVSVPINTDMSPLFSEVFLWSYLARYDESLNAWHQMNTPTDNSIYTGLGYLTYDPTDAAETYIFRGELNYDDVPATLTYTASNRGWNLVGNPYPTTLDWDAITGKTSMGDAIYLWDQVNRRYATYSSGTGGVNGGSQYIAPGQAFFVRTTAADAALTINNTARTLTASTFLKSSEQSPTDVLHLTAKINNMTDEMLVHFNPNATDLFDGAFDAYKLTSLAGSSVPGIYSVDANGTRYSINSLPFHSPEVAVDVVFSIGVDGVATFTASGLETFAQHTGLSIYLKDTKTNQEISLQTTPEYTFNYLSSDDPKRFKIRFAESLTGVNENKVNTLKCNVYSVDKNVTIQYNDWQGKKGNAYIVDAQGRTVKTVLLDGSGSQQIRVPSASGVYLVKLLFSDYTETHKIAIR